MRRVSSRVTGVLTCKDDNDQSHQPTVAMMESVRRLRLHRRFTTRHQRIHHLIGIQVKHIASHSYKNDIPPSLESN